MIKPFPLRPFRFNPGYQRRMTEDGGRSSDMTIAAGFRFSRGLLLCADTQLTYPGAQKLHASKIVRSDLTSMGGGQFVFALTGSAPYAHMAIDHCVRAIKKLKPKDRTQAGLRLSLEETIEAFHQQHVYPHPSFRQAGSPEFQLLIGARSDVDKTLSLYGTSDSALTEVADYEALGVGSFLAHYLVPTIFRHARMTLKDAGNVAIHILRETKEYVDACGGRSEFVVLDKEGKFSTIEAYDISSGEQISASFRSAIRRLFVVAADLDTTEETLKREFDTALTLIQASRRREIAEKKERDAFFKSLEDRMKMEDELKLKLALAKKNQAEL